MRLTRLTQRHSRAALDDTNAFFRSARRYELLTPEEEVTLSRQVQRWVALRAVSRKLTPDEEREFAAGKRARDRMVMANTRFVALVARELIARSIGSMTFADVLQEGNVGLCIAVERFDPTRGYKFCTYARWWIKQQILRAVNTKANVIRLPEKMAQCLRKVYPETVRLAVELGRAPTMEELAVALDVPVKLLPLALHRGGALVSLDAAVCEDGGALIETVANEAAYEDSGSALAEEVWGGYSVLALMGYLTERQRKCVELHYGLTNEEPLTHAGVAERLGVSRSAVQKELHKAMGRLTALARRPAPAAQPGTPAQQCAA